jgi:hypothetical protein
VNPLPIYNILINKFVKKYRWLLLCAIFAIASNFQIQAQPGFLPMDIQAALLSKIIKMDFKLAAKEQVKVLVVYSGKSNSMKEDLVAELENRNFIVKAVFPGDVEQNVKNYDVVYFMPGLTDNTGACKTNKVLTITGVSKYVENGQISIAFDIQNDKPKIFVNVTSLKMEDQNLSSDLMRIAKVYK